VSKGRGLNAMRLPMSFLAGAVLLVVPRSDSLARPFVSLCSLSSFPLGRSSTGTYFVATTLSDTVLAGPGNVQLSQIGNGHWGPGRPRAVYGLLVRVDTLGGAQVASMRAAFARNRSREALIVPWDYDASCQPTYWTRSVQWVRPGSEGFYTVRARPPAEWINGRPTFDAFFADRHPYPHAPFFQAGYRGTDALRTRPSLTPAEMFSLHEALPTASPRDSAAVAPLRQWAAQHPDLAAKFPADVIIATLVRLGQR
jgi:hypothetical protein